jgi:hypothetical protein
MSRKALKNFSFYDIISYMIQKILKSITHFPLIFLHILGETIVQVLTKGSKDLLDYAVLTFKLIWEKTIKIREKSLNLLKYVSVFIASPIVKLWFSISNMRRDMRKERELHGAWGAVKAFFPYFGKFVFGKRGLAVTAFNYAAPILSIVFLLNVVTYATSSNFTLKLTVNGEFLGYIESEQTFLDAEAFVLQRVNYFGSDNTIEIHSDFAIANSGNSEMLKVNQIANSIMTNSGFTLRFAYGFFIDGVCYGAVLPVFCEIEGREINPLTETIEGLLAKYATGEPDEDVAFHNHVVTEFDEFLTESIVDPQEIITMITATRGGEPYLPVTVIRTEKYETYTDFEIQLQACDSLFVGSTNTVQRGIQGVNNVTARVSYLNGAEIGRTVTHTDVVSAPTPQITLNGTRELKDRAYSDAPREYGKFIWPAVSNSRVGQGYFPGHRAIDIMGSGIRGTPIYAAGGGIVVTVVHGWSGYGHYVTIQHECGLRTLYAHLDSIAVVKGEEVIQGEQIGTLGNTGRSDGAHLHFEVIDTNGFALNPLHYLPRS